ncbi:hypothetical protein BJY04DRAFT_230995 [Aspergillus karnatakaensis]|uniref:SDR family oxidoreductase n=1 Tax=Aspergillus karnatakaensis TaxID=1810916 RepID=UPI003CCD40D2
MADPDTFVKAMAFTKNSYRDVYPAIDPSRPELSQVGKVVVITGASRGLGQAMAISFARANAAGIAITGRSAEGLAATEQRIKEINPSTKVLPLTLDVTDGPGTDAAFEEIVAKLGTPHVLINNAGAIVSEMIAESSIDTFWGTMEINLKGTIIATKAFLKATGNAPTAPTTILNLSSVATQNVPATMDSYTIAKLAVTKFTEFLHVEHPEITSISLDPGMVATDMGHSIPLIAPFIHDSVDLAAGGVVWLCSGDKKYLSGRYFSVNWDVEEVEKRKEEIVEKDLLMIRLRRGEDIPSAEELVIHK